MPAVPLIIMGASAAWGAYQQHKQTKAAEQAMQAQTAATQPAFDQLGALAKQAGQTSSGMFKAGMPLFQNAANYWGTLLRGGRSAMQGAMAPEISALTDTYRGAARSIERTAAGPQRDVAMADLARQRASQIGGLALQVRPQAANQVADLSRLAFGTGTQAMGAAGGVLGQILQGQSQLGQLDLARQRFGAEQSSASGKAWGDFITALIGAFAKSKGGGGTAGVSTGLYGG